MEIRYLKDILSEKLPDHTEDELSLPVNEIDTTDVGECDLEELGDLKSVIGVLDLDNSALGRLGDFLPVDTSRKKFVLQLWNDNCEVHT